MTVEMYQCDNCGHAIAKRTGICPRCGAGDIRCTRLVTPTESDGISVDTGAVEAYRKSATVSISSTHCGKFTKVFFFLGAAILLLLLMFYLLEVG